MQKHAKGIAKARKCKAMQTACKIKQQLGNASKSNSTPEMPCKRHAKVTKGKDMKAKACERHATAIERNKNITKGMQKHAKTIQRKICRWY